MAILEMLVVGEYFGQQCYTRWNYLSSGTPSTTTTSFALANAAGWTVFDGADPLLFAPSTVARTYQDVVSTGFTFQMAAVKDLYTPTNFYETTFAPTIVGKVGGPPQSPALAYGFSTNRTTLAIRRGQKRIPAVSEDQTENGGMIEPLFLSGALADLAFRMSEILSFDDNGVNLDFAPVILSGEKVVNPVSGKTSYKPYDLEADQLENLMDGIVWTPKNTVRTQRSRQYNTGI